MGLVKMHEPIRNIPLPSNNKGHAWKENDTKEASEIEESKDQSTSTSSQPLAIPKELWRIVDALWRNGSLEKDLFILPGIPYEVQEIREALDTGADLPKNISIHSLVEMFSLFFTSLPVPIIPSSLLPSPDMDPANYRSFARKLLEQLSVYNYNVLVYIISFFRELLKHADHNKLNKDKLCLVCCQIFLSCDEDYHRKKKAKATSEPTEDSTGEDGEKNVIQMVFIHLLTTSSI